jgi:hypothetical protein
MGLLVIIPVLLAAVLVVGLFVHAVRADPSGEGHRWFVFLLFLVPVAWLIVQIVMG